MLQSAMANFVINYSAKYCKPCLDPELLKSWELYHFLPSLQRKKKRMKEYKLEKHYIKEWV